MTKLVSHRGQSLIEFLLIIPIFILVLITGLQLTYLGFAKNWIRYLLHEQLVCELETRLTSTCYQQSKSKQKLIPFGTLYISRVLSPPYRAQGRARLLIFLGKKKIEINEIINLDITPQGFNHAI